LRISLPSDLRTDRESAFVEAYDSSCSMYDGIKMADLSPPRKNLAFRGRRRVIARKTSQSQYSIDVDMMLSHVVAQEVSLLLCPLSRASSCIFQGYGQLQFQHEHPEPYGCIGPYLSAPFEYSTHPSSQGCAEDFSDFGGCNHTVWQQYDDRSQL